MGRVGGEVDAPGGEGISAAGGVPAEGGGGGVSPSGLPGDFIPVSNRKLYVKFLTNPRFV